MFCKISAFLIIRVNGYNNVLVILPKHSLPIGFNYFLGRGMRKIYFTTPFHYTLLLIRMVKLIKFPEFHVFCKIIFPIHISALPQAACVP